MSGPNLLIVGAGGHAKVVIDAVRANSVYGVAAILDDDEKKTGGSLLGIPIVGTTHDVARIANRYSTNKVCIAIGSCALRVQLAGFLQSQGCELISVFHPSAVIASGVSIGAGTVVLAGAIVNVDVSLSSMVIINTGATIDHDCQIAEGAHIAPGVNLCGHVAIGARTLVGVGARVIPGISVGDDCVIGAGSSVIRSLPDRVLAAGNPARILRSSHTPAT
jgi:sugar O-acyltransferase (sialic acid O-acetyltransferase NeuD family)